LIKLHWIPVFILGACAGYGVALYLNPHKPGAVTVRHDPGPAGPPALRVETSYPGAAPVQKTAPKDAAAQEDGDELARVRALTADHDWAGAIRLATALISRGEARGEELWPYLERAYIALVKASLDQGALDEAQRLLAEADVQLGASAPRLILLAELNQMRGDLDAARTALHQAISLDPSYGEMTYPLVRQVVIALISGSNSSLTFDQKVRILTEEIIDDANFAEYYALLGRLYYRRGNYEEAVANLSYAVQLDHTMGADLSPLVDAARQRLDTPGLVEVPISSQGRTLNVNVRLNDAGRDFHFILDTGASFTAITPDTARALGISVDSGLPRVQLSTANGLIQVPAVTLKAVNLKGALAEDVQAVVVDELNGYDGLLGLSFLNRFNIDINHAEGKLFLSEH